jgi:hypothetical protein
VHDAADRGRVDPAAARAEEQRQAAAAGDEHRPAVRLPRLDRAQGGHPDRHHPFLASLAHHAHRPPTGVERADVEPAQLADPDRRGVQQLDQRVVAQRERVAGRVVGVGDPVLAGREQQVDLVGPEHMRQRPVLLGRAKERAGIAGEQPGSPRERGERAGSRRAPRHRGSGRARVVLLGQPAAQHGQVELPGLGDPAVRREDQQ